MRAARLVLVALAVCASIIEPAWADPSFEVTEPISVPRRPAGFAVGDLNNDGIDDIAIASRGSNKVSIVLVEPDGSFRQGATLVVGTGARDIVIGDFNGDGKGDVALSSGTHNAYIVLGNGDGTFIPNSKSTLRRCCAGFGLAVGDFNNSLPPGSKFLDDLVFADPLNDDVNVLLNKNTPNSAAFVLPGVRPKAGNSPKYIAVGDFNGDQKTDIAALNTAGSGNDTSSILNNGSPNFSNVGNFFSGKKARSLAVGDYNKDGELDLVTVDQRNRSVYLVPGLGGGFFGTGPILQISCGADGAEASSFCTLRQAVIADFDGNGNPDLGVLISGPNSSAQPGGVNQGGNTNSLLIYLGDGSGNFTGPLRFPNLGLNSRFMHLGKFDNRDELPDLAVISTNDSKLRLLLNTTGFAPGATNTPTGGTGGTPTRTPTVGGATVTPTATACRGQGCPCDPENADSDCNEPFLCAVNGEVCCDTDCSIDNVTCDLPGFEGTCKPIDMPDGDECSVDEQCQSGFCVDGVCCESACTGANQRCNVTPGQCIDSTPRPTATPTATSGGSGNTRTPTVRLKELGEDCTAGQQCRSTFCPAEDLVCCDSACNGTNQACDLPTQAGHCLPINLDDGENCVVDAQCISQVCEGGVCAGSGIPTRTPTPKKTNGSQCTNDVECASGNCQDEDGVCCNEVCDGANERCDLDPMSGTCLDTEIPGGGNCTIDNQCISRNCDNGTCTGDGPTPVFTATRTPNGSRIPTNTRTATPLSQPTLILARGSGCNASDDAGSGGLALLLAFPAWWMFTSRSTATVRRKRQQRR